MNAITKTEAAKPSLIAVMASQRGMDPEQFARTVRATVMPSTHTNEQFAALMLVASKYDLDPILKEIYAFPAKGGGIVPIVSIDGWVNLINSHPQFDGVEFDFDHDDKSNLVSCTCRIFRKDRSRPVTVTEYLSECVRNTDPWKMKHRMLRHKAMIQAARYAFGFAGIYDEDEGAKVAEMRDVSSPPAIRPPSPSAKIEDAEIIEPTDAIEDGEPFDAAGYFEELETQLSGAMDAETIEEVWTALDPEGTFDGDDTSLEIASKIKTRRLTQVSTLNAG